MVSSMPCLSSPNDIGSETYLHLSAIIYTVLFAGWTWALISAARGSRRGIVAAFIINGLIWLLIPVGTLLFYCPVDCLAEAGSIFSLVNTLNLILGLMAAVALGLQLRGGKSADPTQSPHPAVHQSE